MKEETKKLLDEAALDYCGKSINDVLFLIDKNIHSADSILPIIETAIEKAVEQATHKWISVHERLPELGERVLVFDKDFGVQIGWLNANKEWHWRGGLAPTEITHWQPLPETDNL